MCGVSILGDKGLTIRISLRDAATGVNDACVKAHSNATWMCVFAQYTFPFITSKVFITEGLYDRYSVLQTHQDGVDCSNSSSSDSTVPICSWQLANILDVGCRQVSSCTNAQNTSIQAYGHSMRASITQAVNSKPGRVGPRSSCGAHGCFNFCQHL